MFLPQLSANKHLNFKGCSKYFKFRGLNNLEQYKINLMSKKIFFETKIVDLLIEIYVIYKAKYLQ